MGPRPRCSGRVADASLPEQAADGGLGDFAHGVAGEFLHEDEETLFLIGFDGGNQVMVLWKEANYGPVGAEPLAWIPLARAAEPEVFGRLLESFLLAIRQVDTAKASDFTAIEVPKLGLLPEADIHAIFAKAFGG